MKMKFVLFSIIIATVNYVLFIISSFYGFPFYGMMISVSISILLAFVLYHWIVKPVEDLKKQLEISSEENFLAERIRREFVANVSHELKTPLTSIQGFLETLQDGAAENPEVRTKFLDIIAIETARLKRLIEDLLILSDIENKRNMGMEQEINVSRSIEEIISSIMPIAEARNIGIQFVADEELTLRGSEDRFKQMMLNLIENAIKYSTSNGLVHISALLSAEENQIIVTIADQGIGIEEEHLSRLFERFYRVDKSRAAKAGGTGLGLSIVKHIANLFNAELQVKSKLNEGSQFIVLFPADKKE